MSEKNAITPQVGERGEPGMKTPPDSDSLSARDSRELHEVFRVDGQVEYRTISWQRLIIILLKVTVATGILGIPGSMGSLGAVPGTLLILGRLMVNTYTACLAIGFRNKHPECHTVVDLCGVMWGRVGRELVGIMFVVAYILCCGSGLLAISIAFNALSDHGACSVWFSFAATVMIVMYSCIRTWNGMTWPMTLGFISVRAGILAVVVGVTMRDRPAAAPQTGPYELGFYVVAHPTFSTGITAVATIFAATSVGPGYIPVIAEMRRPQDYKKGVLPVCFITGAIYISCSMVVYYYCGVWIATPSLGSAGPTIKKIAYGIALPSLVVSGGIFNHTSAKYVFVRVLRGSRHFQTNTWQHWSVWIGLNVVLGMLAFIFAAAIPVFNYILALTGSVCFAPMALIFPPMMWMYEDGKIWLTRGWKGKLWYGFHVLITAVGFFLVVGGTYGTAESIKATYDASANVAFSCRDNSNTVAT